MGLGIYSKKIEAREDIMISLFSVAYSIGSRFDLDEWRYPLDERERREIELIISKKYQGEDNEYLIFNIHPLDSVRRSFELLDLKIGKCYGLAGTDNDKFPYLMYQVGLAYLRLNPEHIIGINGDFFFSQDDLERMESEGGYFDNWCFADLPWQNKPT